MKRLIAVFLLLLCAGNTTYAKNSVSLIQDRGMEIILKFELPSYKIQNMEINHENCTYIVTSDASITSEKGLPALPYFTQSIIIPDDAEMGLDIINIQYKELSVSKIVPSKGVIYRNQNPADIPYKFNDIYTKDVWYPEKAVEIGEPYILRDIRGLVVIFQPFQYNPAKGKLKIAESITVKVHKTGISTKNVLHSRSNSGSHTFDWIYQQRFINYSQYPHRYPDVPDGNKMIVITASEFKTVLEPLVDWKNKKGIKTEMYEYPSETGGTGSDAVKSFIQQKYDSDGITYILLVGDAEDVPTFSAGGGSSDPSYVLLAGADEYPDAFIGRLSVEDTTQAEIVVNKVLKYEMEPDSNGEWYHKATGIASDLGEVTTDKEWMEGFRATLLAYNYTEVDTIYDPGPSASDVSNALNDGRSWVNYLGLGTNTSWETTGFNNSNVSQLNNTDMLPVIISASLYGGDFSGKTCFGEAWLRTGSSSAGTGAILFQGSSIEMAWSPCQYAMQEMVKHLTDDTYISAGGIIYNGEMKMLEMGDDQNTFVTWIVFGDPSLMVFTDTPDVLNVTYPEEIGSGSQDVEINFGSIINGRVCLYSDENGILGSKIVSGNSTILSINVTTEQKIYLTITARNKIPVQEEIDVEPFIKVITPDGGEQWGKDRPYNIIWSDNIDENVRIELLKGGALHSTIAASIPSTSPFLWTIPDTITIGSDYRIRITSVDSNTITDESNNDFTITKNAWDTYPTYDEYLNIMNKFETDYPGLCQIDTFGTSVEGRVLLAAKISDNVSQNEKEPAFFCSATMSGQQIVGYVTMLHLIEYLLSNYGSDPFVTKLVDSIEIWINPLFNPDGTYAGGNNTVWGATRVNANGVDLNRNFHDPVNGLNTNLQMETEAIINFEEQNNIVMGADIHANEYILYPWACQATQTTDLQWWTFVSQQYVDTAREYGPVGFFTTIPEGYSNAFSFVIEAIHGTKLDCSLYYSHCRIPIIGICMEQQVPDSLLPEYWEYNYRALLNYIEQVLYGIRGTVTDSLTGAPLQAKVFVENHDKDSSHVYSHLPHGDYYRPIYEGTYDITFSADGYYPKTISGINVVNNSVTSLDVQLATQSETFTLIFIIKDGKQLPIQGADVTIINTSKISDSTGKAEFELENGLYSYTVSKNGYKDSKGNIEINGSDTVENVTLVSLTAPVCRISPITTEQSDTVFISFTLEDLEYDTLQTSCQYSINDSIWQDATVSGISPYIDSSQYAGGKTLSLTWVSKSDILNSDIPCVSFQIIPNDGSPGIADTIQFHLDNYQGQSVTLTTPGSKQCGPIVIPYSTIDSTRDSIIFKCYYSKDAGQNWTQTYNVDKFKVSPSEYDGNIKWSSSADVGLQDLNSVLLRIIPNDGLGDGTYGVTDSLHIDNSTIPMVVSLLHDPTINNDTVITPVKITAPDFSSVRIIDVNFSVENGIKLPASLLTGLTIQSVNYDSAVIIWPSKRDYASNSSDIKLHFTFRAGSYVQDLTTPPFVLNNNEAPSVKIDSVTGEQQFGDVNIPFTITDTDYDIVNIILQYFDDVSGKWEPATFSGNLSGTISGIDSSHFSDISITWKSGSDFPAALQKSVLFKITPFDDDTGFADSISFIITNVGVPVCDTIIFLEGGVDTLNDSITFLYLLKDDDEDMLNISLYYSSDTGWVKTDNVTGQTTGIPPSSYLGSLTWASGEDFPNMWRPYIRLKLTPEDEHKGQSGESRIFVLKNFDTTVAITGDFSGDNKVDFNDFSYISNYWHKSAGGVTHPDSINELAPYTGDIPYLIVKRDSLFNHKDLSVFIRMCYWSHDNLGEEKLDYSLSPEQNTTSQPEKQNIQISIPNTTDIHILFNVENITGLVSCRYVLSYDNSVLEYTEFNKGDKLQENNGNIFSVVHEDRGSIDIGLARLSSRAMSVSGGGTIAKVIFTREKQIQTTITVAYHLKNSNHETIESGTVELVIPEFEEEESTGKNFFIAFPNPSAPSHRNVPFELIDNPNALQWVQLDNSGFILQFGLNELKFEKPIEASIKIFDAMGNLVNSTPYTDLTLKRDNLNDKTINIYWNGCNKNGRKVGGAVYKVILHYDSQMGSGVLSGNIGVKQK